MMAAQTLPCAPPWSMCGGAPLPKPLPALTTKPGLAGLLCVRHAHALAYKQVVGLHRLATALCVKGLRPAGVALMGDRCGGGGRHGFDAVRVLRLPANRGKVRAQRPASVWSCAPSCNMLASWLSQRHNHY